jgi:hypothetical protein
MAACPKYAVKAVTTKAPNAVPQLNAPWTMPLVMPLHLGAEYSMAKGWPAAYSPPTKMPSTNLSAEYIQKAAQPTWSYVGIAAVSALAVE